MSLSDARKRLQAFNVEFDARMEAQRKVESAALRAAVEAEVWRMHDAGISIAKIMQEYGTKDFRTVKNIIEKRQSVVDLAESLGEVSREGYVYTVVAYGEQVRFRLEDGVKFFFTTDES